MRGFPRTLLINSYQLQPNCVTYSLIINIFRAFNSKVVFFLLKHNVGPPHLNVRVHITSEIRTKYCLRRNQCLYIRLDSMVPFTSTVCFQSLFFLKLALAKTGASICIVEYVQQTRPSGQQVHLSALILVMNTVHECACYDPPEVQLKMVHQVAQSSKYSVIN